MKTTSFFLLLVALFGMGCRKSTPPPKPSTSTVTPVAKAAVIDPATTGSISGVIDFSGVPPKRMPIDMTIDPACELQQKGIPLAEDVVVNAGKLQNVFVYVKSGLGNVSFPPPSPPAVLNQAGCKYVPHVLGVMVGQTLQIENNDRAMHNVHAMPQQNPGWNDSQMVGDAPIQHVLRQPELMIPVGCNQHPWMKMYINVVSNPFFSVSDQHGQFTISGLPPGDYTLEAVQEKLGVQDIPVHVASKQTSAATFRFAAK